MTIRSGATVESATGDIGSFAGAGGETTVNNATWTVTSALNVGVDGTGELMVKAGGSVDSDSLLIGERIAEGVRGAVTVTGANTTMTHDLIEVGHEGEGHLAIEDGGTVTSSAEINHVGRHDGSTGNVTVTGAGSAWSVANFLQIGNDGQGAITVRNGGEVTSGFGTLGRFAASSGTAVLENAGSRWDVTNSFLVGSSGHGDLTVRSGGTLANDWGILGHQSGGDGVAIVENAGSLWSNNDLTVGNGGTGDLTVRDRGRLVVDGALEIGAGSSLTLESRGVLEIDAIDPTMAGLNLDGGTLRVGTLTGVSQYTIAPTDRVELQTFDGDLTNAGVFAPGNSPALTSITGDYTNQDGATLEFEIGGLLAGDQYDRLSIANKLSLAGELRVALIDSFVPQRGDQFDLLDWGTLEGQFDAYDLPALPSGLLWDTGALTRTGQLSVSVVPEPGSALVLAPVGLLALRRRRAA